MIINTFIFKIASRCNLNCSYCYVYNKGDSSWKEEKKIIDNSTFLIAVRRIKDYVIKHGLTEVTITFHGGEPTLAGADLLDNLCASAIEALSNNVKVNFQIQTNGTILNEKFINLFAQYKFSLGISIDGPKQIHDQERKFHSGKGSYDIIVENISLLHEHNIPFSFLCVIPLGCNSIEVHEMLHKFNPESINYIFPDFIYSERNEIENSHGLNPLAEYLIPLIDWWWNSNLESTSIPLFYEMSKLIIGGESQLDIFGNNPLSYIFITSSGKIESLDVLKICNSKYESSDFNVVDYSFDDFIEANSFLKMIYQGEIELSKKCYDCNEFLTCKGGYLPHRYDKIKKFNNPSVWCSDILLIFGHLRLLLNVDNEGTRKRRKLLQKVTKSIDL